MHVVVCQDCATPGMWQGAGAAPKGWIGFWARILYCPTCAAGHLRQLADDDRLALVQDLRAAGYIPPTV